MMPYFTNLLRPVVSKYAKHRNFKIINRFLADDTTKTKQSSKLRKIIEGISADKINVRDGRGWTALMLAAREGDEEATELLLEKGSSTEIRTPSGHTAYDIAIFWRREAVSKLLRPLGTPDATEHYFCADGIVRNSANRERSDWIKETVTNNDNTEFILMHNAKPIVDFDKGLSPKGRQSARPSLMIKNYIDVETLIDDSLENLTYLGCWAKGEFRSTDIGKRVDRHLFAVDVSSQSQDYLVKEMFAGSEILEPFPGLLRLHPSHAGVIAQARSVLDWQYRYRFCPVCGSKTNLVQAGYKRVCSNKSCSSHRGESNTNHPRVDPTVITAIISRDDEYTLLGRKKNFPSGMYSCLAGFVEPGESLEQTCRREVLEEVGVFVDKIRYHSSQPWPMPSALMLGCLAQAEHDVNIQLDEELEDARWFSREEVVQMMMYLHKDGLFVPPRQAMAHQLLKTWLINSAFI